MRKRRLAALLAVALVCMMCALCGCSGSSNDYQPKLGSAEVTEPVIGEKDTLRVGVNTENPPLAGMGSGKIIGLDVDIASAIADELGLKVSIVDVGSDPAGALADGKVDIVMGLDSSSDEGEFWMSDSYLSTGIALFAAGSDAQDQGNEDTATFAAQVSSKSAWAVSNEYGEDALTSVESLSDAFAALVAGEVDYVAADGIIGQYAAHGQGVEASIVSLLMKPTGYCMGVSSDNTELQEIAGDVLERLVQNGTIKVIERKWLGAGLDFDSLPLVGESSSSGGNDEQSGSKSADEAESADSDEASDEVSDEEKQAALDEAMSAAADEETDADDSAESSMDGSQESQSDDVDEESTGGAEDKEQHEEL